MCGEELAGAAVCLDPWHPYIAVGPICQCPACLQGHHDVPGGVDSVISPPDSLSLTVLPRISALRRPWELVSRCLRPSDSTHHFASFPASSSSRWLQLPSLGKPALPSLLRAHLAGVPPWSPTSWPGLSGPSFPLVFVPITLPRHADARRDPLPLSLRPETPVVGRAPPPCCHS